MAAIDPSGFAMSLRVRTVEGDNYPLWFSPQNTPDQQSTVDPSMGIDGVLTNGLPCVESVDIEISLGMNSKLTVQLATTFGIGVQVLRSRLLRIGNTYEMQCGYPRAGRLMPWISALAARPNIKINGDEGLTATLNGEGGAFIALRNSRSREYQNKSYADITREILSNEEYSHIDLDIPDQADGDDPLYTVRERMSQSAQADWFFIQYMMRASNCDAWLEPAREVGAEARQTLKVNRRSNALGAQPRYAFVLQGRSDFDTYFPILDFETQAEGVWLPGAAVSVRTGTVNPDDLTVTSLVTRREDSSIPATGDTAPSDGGAVVGDTRVQLVSQVSDDTQGDTLYISERDPRGQQTVAEVRVTESSIQGGIQCVVTTIGIPDLFPGEIVSLNEAGVFDGLYLVQKVTHRLSESEWSMTLDLINNASSSSLMAAIVGFTPERVNDATVPPPTDADASGGGTEVSAVPGDG